MEKDFKSWIRLKEKLDNIATQVLFKEREIWWCALGCNVGQEANGKNEQFIRPILVFKKLTLNSFVGLPLTTKVKEGSWYVPISQRGRASRVMINQIRIFDSKRLYNKIGALDFNDWTKVKQRFKDFYCA